MMRKKSKSRISAAPRSTLRELLINKSTNQAIIFGCLRFFFMLFPHLLAVSCCRSHDSLLSTLQSTCPSHHAFCCSYFVERFIYQKYIHSSMSESLLKNSTLNSRDYYTQEVYMILLLDIPRFSVLLVLCVLDCFVPEKLVQYTNSTKKRQIQKIEAIQRLHHVDRLHKKIIIEYTDGSILRRQDAGLRQQKTNKLNFWTQIEFRFLFDSDNNFLTNEYIDSEAMLAFPIHINVNHYL